MFRSNKTHDYRRWWSGYAKGWENGSRETSLELREKIIQNILSDAVISTNTDVRLLERIVQIVDES
jgi:hypothetical protein